MSLPRKVLAKLIPRKPKPKPKDDASIYPMF